jgi:hypothetical protein
MKRLLILFYALFLGPSIGLAQENWVETDQNGLTDWTDGYVEATGYGSARYMGNKVQEELMARQAARTSAQARLLEIVNGVRLTGLSTLGTESQNNTRAATRIKGTIKGARVMKEDANWHEDKTSRRGEVVMAEVTLRLCISPRCAETADNLTKASLKPAKEDPKIADQSEESAIILDLNKALYLPSIAPEIIDESGTLIFNEDKLSQKAVQDHGVVQYVKTLAQAKEHPLSGSQPVIISALEINQLNQIVIRSTDADTIKESPALYNGKLIISLD